MKTDVNDIKDKFYGLSWKILNCKLGNSIDYIEYMKIGHVWSRLYYYTLADGRVGILEKMIVSDIWVV